MKVAWRYLALFIAAVVCVAALIFPTGGELGALFEKSWRLNDARAELERTLAKNPDNRYALVNLADVSRLQGDTPS
ncbi:MAG: hypothetical protein V1913_02255, partial [Fibrobacterota bacterium]